MDKESKERNLQDLWCYMINKENTHPLLSSPLSSRTCILCVTVWVVNVTARLSLAYAIGVWVQLGPKITDSWLGFWTQKRKKKMEFATDNGHLRIIIYDWGQCQHRSFESRTEAFYSKWKKINISSNWERFVTLILAFKSFFEVCEICRYLMDETWAPPNQKKGGCGAWWPGKLFVMFFYIIL